MTQLKMELGQVSRSHQLLFRSGQVYPQTLSDLLIQLFPQASQNHNVVF